MPTVITALKNKVYADLGIKKSKQAYLRKYKRKSNFPKFKRVEFAVKCGKEKHTIICNERGRLYLDNHKDNSIQNELTLKALGAKRLFSKCVRTKRDYIRVAAGTELSSKLYKSLDVPEDLVYNAIHAHIRHNNRTKNKVVSDELLKPLYCRSNYTIRIIRQKLNKHFDDCLGRFKLKYPVKYASFRLSASTTDDNDVIHHCLDNAWLDGIKVMSTKDFCKIYRSQLLSAQSKPYAQAHHPNRTHYYYNYKTHYDYNYRNVIDSLSGIQLTNYDSRPKDNNISFAYWLTGKQTSSLTINGYCYSDVDSLLSKNPSLELYVSSWSGLIYIDEESLTNSIVKSWCEWTSLGLDEVVLVQLKVYMVRDTTIQKSFPLMDAFDKYGY